MLKDAIRIGQLSNCPSCSYEITNGSSLLRCPECGLCIEYDAMLVGQVRARAEDRHLKFLILAVAISVGLFVLASGGIELVSFDTHILLRVLLLLLVCASVSYAILTAIHQYFFCCNSGIVLGQFSFCCFRSGIIELEVQYDQISVLHVTSSVSHARLSKVVMSNGARVRIPRFRWRQAYSRHESLIALVVDRIYSRNSEALVRVRPPFGFIIENCLFRKQTFFLNVCESSGKILLRDEQSSRFPFLVLVVVICWVVDRLGVMLQKGPLFLANEMWGQVFFVAVLFSFLRRIPFYHPRCLAIHPGGVELINGQKIEDSWAWNEICGLEGRRIMGMVLGTRGLRLDNSSIAEFGPLVLSVGHQRMLEDLIEIRRLRSENG